jgi:ADP-ribose pyrophosphatase YjhB (NUDIX family)
MKMSSADSSKNDTAAPSPIPRAAVSVSVRCVLRGVPHYLLVQRGREPNKGMWSLPGGKLEFGEGAVRGGVRELREEIEWIDRGLKREELLWYHETVTTTDSIGEGFHYLIAHCFAEVSSPRAAELPAVRGADDAADAAWFSTGEIRDICQRSTEGKQQVTPGLWRVIARMEELVESNLLPVREHV